MHIGECERDAKDGPVFEVAAALAVSAAVHEVRVSRTVVDLVPGSGIAFAERGAMTDEYLRVLRDLWSTDTSSFDGRWKRYARMRLFPKAAAERIGSIPLVVGGNSPVAIRRAAELGDGWHPINLSPAQLAAGGECCSTTWGEGVTSFTSLRRARFIVGCRLPAAR